MNILSLIYSLQMCMYMSHMLHILFVTKVMYSPRVWQDMIVPTHNDTISSLMNPQLERNIFAIVLNPL